MRKSNVERIQVQVKRRISPGKTIQWKRWKEVETGKMNRRKRRIKETENRYEQNKEGDENKHTKKGKTKQEKK